MCLVKKPKIPNPADDKAGQPKALPILRNPILDGMLGNIAALRAGTSAFRIDLLNPLTIPMGGSRGSSSGGSSGSGSSSGGSSSGGSGESGGSVFGGAGGARVATL